MNNDRTTSSRTHLYRDLTIALAFLTILLLTALIRAHHPAAHHAPAPKVGIGTAISLQDDRRPACFVEPSLTPEGYEVIYYPHLAMRDDNRLGFEVDCPADQTRMTIRSNN